MKTIAIFSGGLDSTVMLAKLKSESSAGDIVEAIGFDYGQRHKKELDAAKKIATDMAIRFEIFPLQALAKFLIGSSQTDEKVEVPDGHYAEESMKKTVVPNRNMIMIAIAGGIAMARKYDRVAYAAHHGDHAIYPDCRQAFTDPLRAALENADWQKVGLLAPFLFKSKAELVEIGARIGAPLAQTWSCYKGGAKHCGKCGTCVERKEAFQKAHVEDQTEYAD